MNYENLPVYKDTFDLLVFVYKHTGSMQREYRYTLAEEMKRALQELLIDIYQANIVKDKIAYISNARQKMMQVKVLFRLMRELNQLSKKQNVVITAQIASISKQLANWEKYIKKMTLA